MVGAHSQRVYTTIECIRITRSRLIWARTCGDTHTIHAYSAVWYRQRYGLYTHTIYAYTYAHRTRQGVCAAAYDHMHARWVSPWPRIPGSIHRSSAGACMCAPCVRGRVWRAAYSLRVIIQSDCTQKGVPIYTLPLPVQYDGHGVCAYHTPRTCGIAYMGRTGR